MNDNISLYVPCYNVEKYISRCIEAVLAQTSPPDEILIIDDGSRDRTVELASRYPVRVIKHESNQGLAAARNTGLKSASNELVASLDADCVPEPDWLEKLAGCMDDPNVVMVGGRLVESVLNGVADRWRAAHMRQDWGDRIVTNPPYMFGHDTLVRRTAVAAAGWYDVSRRTNGEDVDLTYRIRKLNFDCVYQPMASINHMRTDSILSIMDTRWRYDHNDTESLGKASRLHLLKSTSALATRCAFEYLKKDIRDCALDLIFLDCFMPFYWQYRVTKLAVELTWSRMNQQD